ncbi:hypothetical protein [Micrococcus lylae]|uniref:hypothetical protein n=1 Tax=Micrococcus lylae TaxID=1273 RepID=UPI00117EAD26|nr:hypothetical protein [Micrococcus lylae]
MSVQALDELCDAYLDSLQTPRGPGQTGVDEYATRLGRGVYERVDPDSTAVTREVELQVRAKWDDASIEDAVRKERYLEQDLVDHGGRETFVAGADRDITRRDVISDYDRAMSLEMPDAVRENILTKQDELASTLRLQGKSEEFIQESLQSQRDVILRDELSKYDLDHMVDLQLGGEDDISNMNWLRKDVNRSFGSQLKWRSKILGVTGEYAKTVGLEFHKVSIGNVR